MLSGKQKQMRIDKIILEQLLFEQLGVGKRDICNDIILSDSCLIEIWDTRYFQFVAFNNDGEWSWEGLDLTDEEIPRYIRNPAQWITNKMEEVIKKADEHKRNAFIIKYLMWKDLVKKSKVANKIQFRLSIPENELEGALEYVLYKDTTAEISQRADEEALEEIPPSLTPEDAEFWDEFDRLKEKIYDELLKEEAIDVCYELEDTYDTFRDKIRKICNKLFGK